MALRRLPSSGRCCEVLVVLPPVADEGWRLLAAHVEPRSARYVTVIHLLH